MFGWVGKVVSKFWSPFSRYYRMRRGGNNEDDSVGDGELIWSKDLEKHAFGEFSIAVAQANENIEDESHVEVARKSTFVGVYDGHGGTDASRFICDRLPTYLTNRAEASRQISRGVLRDAISDTEDGFWAYVRNARESNPMIASAGSCCLVGLIWQGTLYVCNMGDSRAVLGRAVNMRASSKIVADQITLDHNVNLNEVRRGVCQDHQDEVDVVVRERGAWRIKGIIQVSRSIGDVYLKSAEFAFDRSVPQFHLPNPIRRAVVRSDPDIFDRHLQPNDKFVVFASDGLWEYISNVEAVEIVHNSPRSGIARKLIKKALKQAAKKAGRNFKDLKKVAMGEQRRRIHDDITVIVMYIDHALLDRNTDVNEISVRGLSSVTRESRFTWSPDMNEIS